MRLLTLFSFLIIFWHGKSQDYKYGKVSEEELMEKAHPKYPEANAAILFRDNYSHFVYDQQNGFMLVSEFHERIKIYNPEGFKQATKEIILYKSGNLSENLSGLKAFTYTMDKGKIEKTKLDKNDIFEEEQSKYRDAVKFTMPNLKEGAVIEFKYVVRSPFLGNLDEVRFQERIPINRAEARYHFPEYFVYKMHKKGWQKLDIKESNENKTLNLKSSFSRSQGTGFSATKSTVRQRSLNFIERSYDINVSNVPPAKEEIFSGNLNNYLTALKFELSYIKYPDEPIDYVSSTWDDVAKTIYKSDSFGDELRSTNYFEDDLDKVLADAKDKDDKIFKTFNFLKRRMTWNGFTGYYAEEGLKQAYKKQSGNTADINLMLVAMLRYAGFDANPVLVSTKSHGLPIFPTRNGFNYVIAAVDQADGRILMDATSKLGQINMLEEHLLNWNGRLLRKDGTSEWTSLSPSAQAVQNFLVTVDLDNDFNVIGSAKSRFEGYSALEYRKNFQGLSTDDAREKLEKINRGIELADVSIDNLSELNEPVSLSYSFEPLTAVEHVGDKVIISPLFHWALTENPFKSDERMYPIDFSYPRKNRYIISIKIPEGYQIESLPESTILNLFDNMGTFSYRINKSPAGFQVLCEQSINTAMVSPENYQELKKFYNMIMQKEQEKVVLSKI